MITSFSSLFVDFYRKSNRIKTLTSLKHSIEVINHLFYSMLRILITVIPILLFDWYLFRSLWTVSSNWSVAAQGIAYGLFGAITLSTLVFLVGTRMFKLFRIADDKYSVWRGTVMSSYIAKFFMTLVLIADELRRLMMGAMGNGFEKSIGMQGGALALGAGLFALLVYGIVRNRHRYEVVHQSIPIKNLPEGLVGLTIAQISDVHSGSFSSSKPIERGIEMMNALKPDLVFFTGDLVNNVATEIEPYIPTFSKIKAKYGVYSILGNHDYGDYVRWSSIEMKQHNLKKLINNHRLLGWDLLLNEHRKLHINGEDLAIIGVENFSGNPRFSKYGNLAQAYAGSEEIPTKLLLSHDPSHWKYEIIKRFKDIAVTFSGHTHGMQFGFQFFKKIKWSPVQYAYREWLGLYQEGAQYLYVNRGFGYLAYPGRVGMLPEITFFTLEKAI